MKNYEELFHEQYSVSQNIDETFANLKNQEGMEKAIDYLRSIGATWLNYESYLILFVVNEFTKSNSEYNLEDFYNVIRNYKDVNSLEIVEGNVDRLKIDTIDFKLDVRPFSKVVPMALLDLPDLENSDREGTCFDKAYTICMHTGGKADLVTGFTYGYCDKSKFLHSWVETNINGEDYVIDGTLNAIINKDGYYGLRRANVISRISGEQLVDDIENYLVKLDKFPLEIYFTFRDEIMRDLKKNAQLFESKKM